RMAAFARILRPLGVDVAARVAPAAEGGLLVVARRDGSQEAEIACVPFVPERRFGDAAALFDASESWYQSYAEGMGKLLGAMDEGFGGSLTTSVTGRPSPHHNAFH